MQSEWRDQIFEGFISFCNTFFYVLGQAEKW